MFYDGTHTHILNWEEKKLSIKENIICRFDFFQETASEIENILKNNI